MLPSGGYRELGDYVLGRMLPSGGYRELGDYVLGRMLHTLTNPGLATSTHLTTGTGESIKSNYI